MSKAALNLMMKSDTSAFFFDYGVTNRFDLGVAVPVLRVAMDLTYRAKILDLATHSASPTTHAFATHQRRMTSTPGAARLASVTS